MVSLLVICSANVCRSVFAAALLTEALTTTHPDIDVSSAGVHARPGMDACRLVDASSPSEGAGSGFIKRHLSSPVTPSSVDDADLILTATSSQRSAISSMQPDTRTKTFTLLEAAGLAEMVRIRPPDGKSIRFADWVRDLDASRGWRPPASPRGWWKRAAGASEIDIRDGHVEGNRLHRKTLNDVDHAVGRLVRALPRLSNERGEK